MFDDMAAATRRVALLLFVVASASCNGNTSPSAGAMGLRGHWVGTYVFDRCVFSGWPDCSTTLTPAEQLLDLELEQTGAAVTGSLRVGESLSRIPVAGTTDGQSLTLAGSFISMPINKAINTTVIADGWTTTLVATHQMTGTFTFRAETTFGIASPPSNPPGETWTRTYSARITTLVRQPN